MAGRGDKYYIVGRRKTTGEFCPGATKDQITIM